MILLINEEPLAGWERVNKVTLDTFPVLSMNKIRQRDELCAPNRWGKRFVFSTKTASIYSINV